jgi:hypothetical protein
MTKRKLLKLIEQLSYEPKDKYDLGWRDALDTLKVKVK